MKFLHQRRFSLLHLILIFLIPFSIGMGFMSYTESAAPENIPAPPKKDSIISVITPVKDITKDTSALAQLLFTIDTLAQSPALLQGHFGFSLVTLDSNRIISEYSRHKSLVPASVVKALCTGVALAKLGPDYQYKTNLQYDGKIDTATKILHGNIYIRGSGDPSLGSDAFGNTDVKSILASWSSAIKDLGIDSIDGTIIGDGEYFEHDLIPGGWAWEDITSSYGIGCSGLAFRENTYDVNVKCKGKSVQASIYPPVPGIILHNQILYNDKISKNYLFVAGAPYQNERFLLGEVRGNCSERSNLPDPALCCAYNLLLHLKSKKIGIKDSCTTVYKLKLKGGYAQTERKTFHITYSPPLSKLVNYTNKTSQNFYAEALLKTLSAEKTGYGSTAGGLKEIVSYFREKNIDLHGFYMVDGSGLSRFNSLSPKFLTDMLVAYAQDSTMFSPFFKSLSVAGESGTMNHMVEETIAAGNIHAKSGTMNRVRSYAGYVTTKSGRMLAFSMIMNNHGWDSKETKERMEKIMVLMANLD
jgi:serine-type D-Ala-D-Ala carboxypeptidase/endopeptidase (penicillin-binding protein 4)